MILQRYIFRELLGSFLFSFFTVLAVCQVGTAFQVFRTFPGLGLVILAKALPLGTGAMTCWVMLVASCTSSTLVYARLAAENEITAMRTCGIHTGRIVAPALLLGLIMVAISYPLNEYVVPWARNRQRQSVRESTLIALHSPPAGNQDFKIGNTRLTYTDFQDGRMENPTISLFKLVPLKGQVPVKGQPVLKDFVLRKEYYARSGVIRTEGGALQLVLTKPRCLEIKENGQEENISAENDVAVDLNTEEFDKASRQLIDQPQAVLWEQAYATRDDELRNSILVILHTRYAASLAPLLLVMVGMPVGILVRRGSRLAGLGAALPPLLIYFVSYFIFQGLGDKSRVSPLLAAYAPDLFLGSVALALQWGISRR